MPVSFAGVGSVVRGAAGFAFTIASLAEVLSGITSVSCSGRSVVAEPSEAIVAAVGGPVTGAGDVATTADSAGSCTVGVTVVIVSTTGVGVMVVGGRGGVFSEANVVDTVVTVVRGVATAATVLADGVVTAGAGSHRSRSGSVRDCVGGTATDRGRATGSAEASARPNCTARIG
jgi:hypothetical protein